MTIATNMAGRGTDIQLGGNVEMQIKGKVDDDDPNFDQKKTKIEQQVLKEQGASSQSRRFVCFGYRET